MLYIIRTDEPFRGHVQSMLDAYGLVAWSGGLTFNEYAATKAFPLKIITEAELEAMLSDWTAAQITEPTEETAEAWDYALGCLPPCRWQHVRGVELFHISERITHDLVSWHARFAGRCWTFTDKAGADMGELAAKVAKAAGHA